MDQAYPPCCAWQVLVCPDKTRPEENKERALLGYGAAVDCWCGGRPFQCGRVAGRACGWEGRRCCRAARRDP
jgi:hypothetical protein